MHNSIRIRYARREDIYAIAAFLNDCWKAEYRQIISDDYLDMMSVEERHEGLLKRYNNCVSDFFMMLEGDCLIGAVVFGKSFTDGYKEDGEISAIYLHEDYIGKGYGHRLFRKTEQALAAKGHTCFLLDLLTGNARALRFYLAHGYEKVADRHLRLGDNDYPLTVMRKKNPFTLRQEVPDDDAAVYKPTRAK
jgi:ribosomal protein S18 acetylase RimI-like enzyme